MKPFALCIDNTDFEENLIRGKIYRVLPDPKAAREGMVRIVDESDEEGLYRMRHFELVDFPDSVKKKILAMGASSAESPDAGSRQSEGSAGSAGKG